MSNKDTPLEPTNNLPPVIADDEILKNILKPHTNVESLENPPSFPDCVPVNVNFVDPKIQQAGEKKMAIIDVHNDKQVAYDLERGIVTSNWSKFQIDPKADPLTSDPNGIFIKHLASTVINPGQGVPISPEQMKKLGFDPRLLQAGKCMTNVFLYKPKEKVFTVDPDSRSGLVQVPNTGGGQNQQQPSGRESSM